MYHIACVQKWIAYIYKYKDSLDTKLQLVFLDTFTLGKVGWC